MRTYTLFTAPEATAVMAHDHGEVVTGVNQIVSDRPAKVFSIPDEVPNGWGARLTITREGYLTESHRGILIFDVHGVGLFAVDDVELIANPIKPLTPLVADGQFLKLATGERFTAIEASDFQLYQRYLNGEDIRPVLADRRATGFNMLRVFGTCMQMFRLVPSDYGDRYFLALPGFVALAASYGLYVDLVAFADARLVMPDKGAQKAFWGRLGATVSQRRLPVLLSLVNESDQTVNLLDCLNEVSPIQGVLCSHGSNGSQAPPPQPAWGYQELHTNDAFEWQRKVGHNAMELWTGPSIATENTRPDHDTAMHHFEDAAEGAALLCAGSCFHSNNGKFSQVFDDTIRPFAKAWVRGAKSVPLEYQAGRYNHDASLEGPDDLRVYQRILEDGRSWTVRIRK